MWGFECSCSLCSASSTKRQASEARVHQIDQLQRILIDWSKTSPATSAHALKLIKLYAKESLYAALGTGHMFAALAFNAEGDTKKAKKHAEKAIEAGILGNGDQERDEKEMKSLLTWGNKQ